MGRILTVFKLAGTWLGPMLILIGILLVLFPPMPFGDVARMPASLGAMVSGLAWFLGRKSNQTVTKRVLISCAMTGLVYFAWSNWTESRGYTQETVVFDNDDVSLVGTLYLPEKKNDVPGIVFLGGSGAFPRSLYRPFGAHFARAGYALLVYDKRGVGDSTGIREAVSYTSSHRDMEGLASDAAAALSYLASRPEVQGDVVGFIGVSEGGIIAPRAAALNGHAAFMLALTGSTSTTGEIVRHQYRSRKYSQYASPDKAEAAARKWFGNDFDPKRSLRALDVPGLWLLAGQETQFSNEQTMRFLDAMRNAGKPYEYHVFPNAWHGLFFAPKQQTLDIVHTWLARVTVTKRQYIDAGNGDQS